MRELAVWLSEHQRWSTDAPKSMHGVAPDLLAPATVGQLLLMLQATGALSFIVAKGNGDWLVQFKTHEEGPYPSHRFLGVALAMAIMQIWDEN